MFNQIIKAFKSDDKKRAEEIEIRLNAIIQEVNELFTRRVVNYYEAMDILHSLQGSLNFQIGAMLKQNHETINKQKLEINELTLKTQNYGLANESEKNTEQKTTE